MTKESQKLIADYERNRCDTRMYCQAKDALVARMEALEALADDAYGLVIDHHAISATCKVELWCGICKTQPKAEILNRLAAVRAARNEERRSK